jgi:hypothetical protein
VQTCPVIEFPEIAAPEPVATTPPMRPEIASWIDRWCDDEGISRRRPWRRLFT